MRTRRVVRALAILTVPFVLVPLIAVVAQPTAAFAQWPFPDDSSLPVLADDSRAGNVSASYRVTVTGRAGYLFEAAAQTQTRRLLGGLVAVWNVADPARTAVFTATTTLTSTSRIRIASEPAMFQYDSEPSRSTGPALIASPGTLEAGTYQVVMLVGGEDPNVESMFRIRGGAGMAVTASSFGSSLVAGEETFHGALNATAANGNVVVDGTVSTVVHRTLTGVFLTPEAVGVTTTPSGAAPAISQTRFVGTGPGPYRFTVVAGTDPPVGGSPPIVLLADVALA